MRSVTAVTVTIALIAGAPVAAAPAPAGDTPPARASGTAPPEVERAASQFAAAGLRLPPIVVDTDETGASCKGGFGVHRARGDYSEIVLCSALDGFEWRLVLHELAHAWIAFELTAERKAEFRQLRGYEHWRDHGRVPWAENGTEQAAEIIAWGVSDRPYPVMVRHGSCTELEIAYRTMTGFDPVAVDSRYCDRSSTTAF